MKDGKGRKMNARRGEEGKRVMNKGEEQRGKDRKM